MSSVIYRIRRALALRSIDGVRVAMTVLVVMRGLARLVRLTALARTVDPSPRGTASPAPEPPAAAAAAAGVAPVPASASTPPAPELTPTPQSAPEASAASVPDLTLPGSHDRDDERRRWKREVYLLLIGALVTAMLTNWWGPVTGWIGRAINGTPLTPAQQLNIIAGRLHSKYKIFSEPVKFAYGPSATVMILTPRRNGDSCAPSAGRVVCAQAATVPAELRIYSVPRSGQVTLQYTFAPRMFLAQSSDGGRSANAGLGSGELFIGVDHVRAFNGSPGTEMLLNLYDPQQPHLDVIPMLLSQNLPTSADAPTTFSMQPLLSPASIGPLRMSQLLTTRYLTPSDWARAARNLLYDTPVRIDPGGGRRVIRAYAVSGYEYAPAAATGASAGSLILAAGYVARGGNLPSPSILQILRWTIDLTGPAPVAVTSASDPDVVHLPPSASPDQVDNTLRAAVDELVSHSGG